MSNRRLFVSKCLHWVDLRRMAGGNVAGDERDGHQERRHKNQSEHIVSLYPVEKVSDALLSPGS